VASSVALVSFGLDSVIEVGAAVVVLWQFLGIAEERERRALKLIGGSFFALAAYVLYSSASDLVRHSRPEVSTVGIVLTATSMVVMPLLAAMKRRTANSLGSRTLLADSKQTSLCAYLALSTLAGLAMNAAFHWWWTDAVAALFIAFVAVREGREAWAGETDCC
jgi:divalent metal cation (Fe/Co/Zn/Cd) transporter